MSEEENQGFSIVTATFTPEAWAALLDVREKVAAIRDELLRVNPDRMLSAFYTGGGPFDLAITTNLNAECVTSLVVALNTIGFDATPPVTWMQATAVPAVRAEHVRPSPVFGFICC
jgi:hypothetical protein